MGVWPESIALPAGLTTIMPWSLESLATHWGGNPASAAWFAANTALYVPFRLSRPFTAVQAFVYNGATASGNLDLGVYDAAGTRIVATGSTAQSGTSTLQTIDITDTTFGPGLFYLALVFDSTTATVFRVSIAANSLMHAMGCAQQASALPLPAAATFASCGSSTTLMPFFGIAGKATS